jgi:hypothetical protein
MGEFLNEKNIINNTIRDYNNYVNDKGKFIEGSETFVTYYSKNNKASTEDIGLGNVVEIVGTDSPIKFNRIEDFPLYNFDELQLQYEYDDELGVDSSIDGTAVILPGTIKPLPDDYFSVSYLNRKYLFKITNIEGSSLGSKFFYKIDYSLSSSNINVLEERQIEERYNVIYDNVGTKSNSIIKESIKLYIDKIDKKIDFLKKIYERYYYNEKMNLFIFNDEIYDNDLHEFINKNNLFIKQKTFLKNILVQPIFDIEDSYFYSIFEVLENDDKELGCQLYNDVEQKIICRNKTSTLFAFQFKPYYKNVWKESSKGIFDSLVNAFVTGESDDWSTKIFLEYFEEKHCLEDKVKEILNLLNNRISNNLTMYIFVPCYLFILLKLREEIINK